MVAAKNESQVGSRWLVSLSRDTEMNRAGLPHQGITNNQQTQMFVTLSVDLFGDPFAMIGKKLDPSPLTKAIKHSF